MKKSNVLDDKLLQIKNGYTELKAVVKKHFPSVWPQLHASVAASTSLVWSDIELPVTLIVVGPSSSGKTLPLMWIAKGISDLIVRCDDFTPASFVSHAANRNEKALAKIDLLPKIKNKIFCTKEMAPIFSGRDDELQTNFAKLTSILDGEGLVTSSGSHGTRGYNERILFVWLGATTPVSKKVFGLMSSLGTRFFFFSTDAESPVASDYKEIIAGQKRKTDGKEKCQEAISRYLELFFGLHAINSISLSTIMIPDHIVEAMAQWCEALTRLRGSVSIMEGKYDDGDRHAAPAIEHGWRAAEALTLLVKSSALARGSIIVEDDDYQMVRHICLSSMPEMRRKVFEALLSCSSSVKALTIAEKTNMAKKTAIHYLKELKILGIIEGDLEVEPFYFTLKAQYEALRSHTTTNSVTVTEPSVTKNEDVCATDTQKNLLIEEIEQTLGARKLSPEEAKSLSKLGGSE